MSRSIAVTSLIVLASCVVFSQTAPAPLAFEVAAIKPSDPAARGSTRNGTKSEIVMRNFSLKRCVEMAYDVRDFSFSGPDWLDTTHFDITAKPPAGYSEREQFGPMMQTLLAERFKLAIHRESKVMPAYALVQAKSGIKLKAVDAGDGGWGTNESNGLLTATRLSMPRLADFLARTLNSPVVDKTEVPGVFSFKLEFSRDEVQAGNDRVPDKPSIYTALQEQLGLRLVPQKLPIEIVVVDHIERTPTEN
jgi:uncharacterized protein (TIGR03435 family)